MKKKSDSDAAPRAPISFHPMSNGEFEPRPVNDRDRLAATLYRRLVDEKAARFGMTRRQFTESASGMLGALYVMNQAYGCSSKGAAFTRDGGFDVPADVSAADASQARDGRAPTTSRPTRSTIPTPPTRRWRARSSSSTCRRTAACPRHRGTRPPAP